MGIDTFQPHPLVRNRHIQTIFRDLYPIRDRAMRQAAQEMILTVAGDVRLQGFYSPQSDKPAKGLVLLLHGWLGNVQSHYMIALGECLYRWGYAIFRLNQRDHGHTHHLNAGLYRGDLLDEVFEAAGRIAALEPDVPLHIVGASLGGNYALRLAWRYAQTALFNLGQTVAVSPALDPYRVSLALDNGPWLYLAYFRRKWRKAFRHKKEAYPDRYDDFAEVLAARTCTDMSEIFARRYSPYPDAAAYFNSYTVTPAMMAELRTPVTILSALDDPIVPVETLYPFHNVTPHLQAYLQPYGGHVGFLDILPRRSWLCESVLAILDEQ